MQRDRPPVLYGRVTGEIRWWLLGCCEGGRGIEGPVLGFKCVGEWGCGGTAGRDWIWRCG